MGVGERIKHLRKGKYTQSELAELIGVHETTIRRWEQERDRGPDLDTLKRIAHALETSVAYLTGETDDPKRYASILGNSPELDGNKRPLSPAAFISLSPSKEGTLLGSAPFPESNVHLLSDKIVEVPVYLISACMGKGFDNEGEDCTIIDTLYLSRDSVGVDVPERPFALLVEGNSMSPSIEDGERVVVNPNITPGRGDVCLARIRSNGYFRDSVKFYFPRPSGGCILKSSETSGIPPLEFTVEEVKENDVVIVGRVVYIDTGRKI